MSPRVDGRYNNSIQFHNDRAGEERIIEFGTLASFLPRDGKETGRKRLVKFSRKRRHIELLFGAPGETQETVRETIDFIKRINPERVSVTVGLRIFPGTELERMIRSEGLNGNNPNLHGHVDGNGDLLHPVFYLPTSLGPEPQKFIAELIGDDPRFFGANTSLFNNNANDALVEAIAQGERGAYWSILKRIEKRYAQAQGGAAVQHGSVPRVESSAARPHEQGAAVSAACEASVPGGARVIKFMLPEHVEHSDDEQIIAGGKSVRRANAG